MQALLPRRMRFQSETCSEGVQEASRSPFHTHVGDQYPFFPFHFTGI